MSIMLYYMLNSAKSGRKDNAAMDWLSRLFEVMPVHGHLMCCSYAALSRIE
jgi:hypothetical protein